MSPVGPTILHELHPATTNAPMLDKRGQILWRLRDRAPKHGELTKVKLGMHVEQGAPPSMRFVVEAPSEGLSNALVDAIAHLVAVHVGAREPFRLSLMKLSLQIFDVWREAHLNEHGHVPHALLIDRLDAWGAERPRPHREHRRARALLNWERRSRGGRS